MRIIEWIKTNPQPINSKINYLSNCREFAISCIKKSKPVFNSKYDNGIYTENDSDVKRLKEEVETHIETGDSKVDENEIYYLPIQSKNRIHSTQKSLTLFEQLVEKHSNVNGLVVDPFLGGGTTAYACKKLGRNFRGSELNKNYYDKVMEQLNLQK